MPTETFSSDVLEGADAIAAFLGMPKRRVFYLCETKQIPAFKIGGKWTTRKSTLRAYFDRLEAASMPDFAA